MRRCGAAARFQDFMEFEVTRTAGPKGAIPAPECQVPLRGARDLDISRLVGRARRPNGAPQAPVG